MLHDFRAWVKMEHTASLFPCSEQEFHKVWILAFSKTFLLLQTYAPAFLISGYEPFTVASFN